ncbi:IbrB-like domain-containing protein [Gemella haemolysans]|uniref:IbrB-like domain-containing protein n=1 Tax=Gemella haemolysans TaxID=1379 RepID=UPI0019586130|nr:ParB/RepB/Spo0J family partition protein [Gemella haemolysans]VTX72222.1 ParB-like nuclease domain protein [Gemella haemolysans]
MKKLEFPCLQPKLVSIDKVVANNYNPNKVAKPEMELLYKSILEDGLTMPVVTFYDDKIDKYVIVDGFHRYTIVKDYFKSDVVAISVIDKDIKQRMASTVRHNRARGVHKVDLQADMVVDLLKKGWNDNDISKELGMTLEEVLRLKQQTGIAELFKDRTHSKSWVVN